MSAPPLTHDETAIVTLITAGFTRGAIARILNVSEDYTREMIRELCERFDCRMDKLPDAVKQNTRSE